MLKNEMEEERIVFFDTRPWRSFGWTARHLLILSHRRGLLQQTATLFLHLNIQFHNGTNTVLTVWLGRGTKAASGVSVRKRTHFGSVDTESGWNTT